MTQECGEIHHPIFSRVLAWLSEASLAETRPFRQELLAGLSGRVIEVGAGTGINSVTDQARALSELFRVIRPGGELRFYEHVRAGSPGLARLQRAVDALFWPRIGGGCHTSRDTRAAIEEAGFVIESCREFSFMPCFLLAPVSPHILGIARRP